MLLINLPEFWFSICLLQEASSSREFKCELPALTCFPLISFTFASAMLHCTFLSYSNTRRRRGAFNATGSLRRPCWERGSRALYEFVNTNLRAEGLLRRRNPHLKSAVSLPTPANSEGERALANAFRCNGFKLFESAACSPRQPATTTAPL